MKIGIIISSLSKLENWNLILINEIIKSEKLNLSLILDFDDTHKPKNNLYYKFITKIEYKFLKNHDSKLSYTVLNHLHSVNNIKINSSLISETESLDLILNLSNKNIKNIPIKEPQNGIWSLFFSDKTNYIINGDYAGFNTIMYNKASTKVVIGKQLLNKNSFKIIDSAFFNLTFSFIKTNQLIKESSVSLLMKNLNLLAINSSSKTNEICSFKDKIDISLWSFIRYYFLFATKKIIFNYRFHFLRKLNFKFLKWSFAIGDSNFLDTDINNLHPFLPPKNQFWADPFFLSYNNEDYIFFENYEYNRGKAIISCGKLVNKKIKNITTVLDLDYHLSYPYIFNYNNEIFLMPETSANKRLEIYKNIKFPDQWELYASAFEGEEVFDAHFYFDGTTNWLFINKKSSVNASSNSELYIYKVDSPQLKKITPHKQNPVIINSETARNAGSIFEYKNEIYRPSQYNAYGIYGKGININKINKLTIDEYNEEKVILFETNKHSKFRYTHHLNQINGKFVIDVCF